ncbi:MAG TPA: hypothetical protein VK495_10265 [Steroidobacteraceae bacterium]|nr:hypothetical protein [Steroidobacteraceae bacterium]
MSGRNFIRCKEPDISHAWRADDSIGTDGGRAVGKTRAHACRMTRRLKLASLNRESSNQLLETLEEWNDHLEAAAWYESERQNLGVEFIAMRTSPLISDPENAAN